MRHHKPTPFNQPNLSPILTLPEEMYTFDSPLEDTFFIDCDLAQSLRNLVYDHSNSEFTSKNHKLSLPGKRYNDE